MSENRLNVIIRTESEQDWEAVAALNRQAFEGDAEASLVGALRDAGDVIVSLVAEHEGRIVGHILFSRLQILRDSADSADPLCIEAASLAPMAVLPDFQRRGIGGRLVEEGLQACRESGQSIVTVLGHADFYPRFGFRSELAQVLDSPFGGGDVWMAIELAPGALQGVQGRVRYAAAFDAL